MVARLAQVGPTGTGLKRLFFVPPNPMAFVGGFFAIPRATDVASIVLEKEAIRGLRVARPVAKAVATGISVVSHILMQSSFSLGWMLGELNDLLEIGVVELAKAIKPATGAAAEGAMLPEGQAIAGVIGRKFGFEQGGVIGRRFGFEQGQAPSDELERLRRLRERLGVGEAGPHALSGGGHRGTQDRATFVFHRRRAAAV